MNTPRHAIFGSDASTLWGTRALPAMLLLLVGFSMTYALQSSLQSAATRAEFLISRLFQLNQLHLAKAEFELAQRLYWHTLHSLEDQFSVSVDIPGDPGASSLGATDMNRLLPLLQELEGTIESTVGLAIHGKSDLRRILAFTHDRSHAFATTFHQVTESLPVDLDLDPQPDTHMQAMEEVHQRFQSSIRSTEKPKELHDLGSHITDTYGEFNGTLYKRISAVEIQISDVVLTLEEQVRRLRIFFLIILGLTSFGLLVVQFFAFKELGGGVGLRIAFLLGIVSLFLSYHTDQKSKQANDSIQLIAEAERHLWMSTAHYSNYGELEYIYAVLELKSLGGDTTVMARASERRLASSRSYIDWLITLFLMKGEFLEAKHVGFLAAKDIFPSSALQQVVTAGSARIEQDPGTTGDLTLERLEAAHALHELMLQSMEELDVAMHSVRKELSDEYSGLRRHYRILHALGTLLLTWVTLSAWLRSRRRG